MITNTRLQELRMVAHQCEQKVNSRKATIMEKDFVDLYEIMRDHMTPVQRKLDALTKGPHFDILFGQ